MTQLKNQDPTAPLDTNQFTSQLVQFSSVEQQINANSNLNTLIGLQQGNQVLQSSALIGKTVHVTSSQIDVQNGSGSVQFSAPMATTANITITSPSGNIIKTATVQTAQGQNSWAWNGKDDNGHPVADGGYDIGVSLGKASGMAKPVPFTVSGVATGIEHGAAGTNVRIGSLLLPLTDVQSIQ